MLNAIIKDALRYGFIKEADKIWAYNTLLDDPRIEALVPRPSEVIAEFNRRFEQSAQSATDWYYQFSMDSNYIQIEAVKKNIQWLYASEFGNLEITINMSKPEKDPRDIAKALTQAPSGNDYPKCLLCKEAEGYHGRAGYPDRSSHRIIPLDLAGSPFYLQYSPYVYYNEHCIVLDYDHTPMKITRKTFERLFAFLERFPHYIIGSNADLPIVGGSILTHEHFQGGRHSFPIENAPLVRELSFEGFSNVSGGIVKWPLSVLRLCSKDYKSLIDLSELLLKKWRNYSDETQGITAFSGDTPHNTITPIVRMRGGLYEIDLVLRCNITSSEHPLGVFHPHSDCHHIKKENIGLIEAMGLAILPPRLTENYDLNSESDRAYIGSVFSRCLQHCGVFKQTPEGLAAFCEFVQK